MKAVKFFLIGLISIQAVLAGTAFCQDITSFKFVVFGDFAGYGAGRDQSNVLDVFDSVLEDMKKMNIEPLFALHVGDLVDDGGQKDKISEWKKIGTKLNGLQYKKGLHIAPGNNDPYINNSSHSFANWDKYCGKPHSDIVKVVDNKNAPDVILVILNSSYCKEKSRDPQQSIKPENLVKSQTDQMKKNIPGYKSKDEDDLIIAVMHHPVWGKSSCGKDKEKYSKDLHGSFKDAGVDMVFTGHTHNAEFRQKGEISYYRVGSSGGAIYKEKGDTLCDGKFYHYVIGEVKYNESEKSYEVQIKYVKPGGHDEYLPGDFERPCRKTQ